MGLRTKITLALSSILLLLAGLTVAIQRADMQRSLKLLESRESTGDLRRLLMSLDAQILQLDTLLISWSNWTSLYEHAGKANPKFVKNELDAQGIHIAHIDWLLRFTPEGAIGDFVEAPQPDGSTPLTTALATLPGMKSALAATLRNKTTNCTPMALEQKLALMCYRPLHLSSGEGVARGSVVIGRWIDEELIHSLIEQTELRFSLAVLPSPLRLPESDLVPDEQIIDTLMGRGTPSVTRQDHQLLIEFPITDLFQQHIGSLRMEWPRRSSEQATASMTLTRNLLLALLVVASVLSILLIDRIVVRRLRQLKSELGAIVQDKDWNGTIDSTGQDEIAELAIYINTLKNELRSKMLELRTLSSVDSLTGLPNRRVFDARLAQVVSQYTRAQRAASLVLIDIDHFKRYNDTYGHPSGDAALQRVATCIQGTLRRELDLPARLGGEEFAVILNETALEGARTCADMLRRAVMDAAIEHAGNMPLGVITISCGVASLQPGDDATTLYERADKALYLAKTSGRNQVSTGD